MNNTVFFCPLKWQEQMSNPDKNKNKSRQMTHCYGLREFYVLKTSFTNKHISSFKFPLLKYFIVIVNSYMICIREYLSTIVNDFEILCNFFFFNFRFALSKEIYSEHSIGESLVII